MAIRDDLIEALNTCIDRLNQGEAIEDILQDYPTLANQLRPMLETGLLYPRARFPVTEVEAVEAAGEAAIRSVVQQEFRGGPGIIHWLLVLLFIIGGGAVAIIATWDSGATLSITETATTTMTATTTITRTSTLTPSVTPISSATPTSTMTASVTPPPTNTPLPSPVVTATPRSVAIVIEGPVSSINDQTITIYDFVLTLEPDNPILAVIRPGDILRIEGFRSETTIQVISVVFVDVLVLVEGEQIWRGDDCAVPPPDWAQDLADIWYAQCLSAFPSGGNSGGSTDSDDDDDDGGDDDD